MSGRNALGIIPPAPTPLTTCQDVARRGRRSTNNKLLEKEHHDAERGRDFRFV
jgi:hypothetical protein